jgi:hypothetical protein
MELLARRFKLVVVLATAVPLALFPLFHAAGKGVAVAATVVALAMVVTAYVGSALLILRLPGDQRAEELLRRWGSAPVVIMFGASLVVIAAHPWGIATAAVGLGVMFASQLSIHAAIVVVALRQRRSSRRHRMG